MALYFGLGFTSRWLAQIPLLAPPPLVPPDFGPDAVSARVPGILMGMPLAGQWFRFNHIWQPWNLLLIVPTALLGAYIAQRRRNTWILIVMHGLMNLTLVVGVVVNVAGVMV